MTACWLWREKSDRV